MSSTFISRLITHGSGLRVAVKDAIDVAGVPTTAGSRVVALHASPAVADAACLSGMRDAGVRFVGKTNLHELCFGGTGINPWFGTPVNPLDPACIPGGSSSGSAVAVANDEADLALGTDTAGSIRNPAACCGVAGLKTTWGRVSLEGVWPLAPSLDTVGLLGRSVARLAQGMALIEPGFAGSPSLPGRIGRIRGLATDPLIDEAIDRALAQSGLTIIDVRVLGWQAAAEAGVQLTFAEALAVNRALVDEHLGELGPDVIERFTVAKGYAPDVLPGARAIRRAWRDDLARTFEQFDLLALPSMAHFPPRLDDSTVRPNPLAVPISLAGHPALSIPVPTPGRFPASLQLFGPDDSEDLLLTAGALVEEASA